MQGVRKLRTLCKREDWNGSVFWHVEQQGDLIFLDGKQYSSGYFCLAPIDSRFDEFQWSRVQITCDLPEDCLISVHALATDELEMPEEYREYTDETLMDTIHALPGMKNPKLAAEDIYGPAIANESDVLVRGKGRYLLLMIELSSTGGRNPSVSKVSVQMAGDHMTDYLPEIYRDDDFTYRFLSIFNSLHIDLEQKIEDIPKVFDIERTSNDMLGYLASWLCIDATGKSRDELKKQIRKAFSEYETMYTVDGIRASVQYLTGVNPLIIEAKDVDPNGADCKEPEVYRRLYGENLRKFFVLLKEGVFPDRKAMDRFVEDMQKRIPAGVAMELIQLRSTIQLDKHTYLGLNTVIQGYNPVTIDENSTIQYGTMIGGGEKLG